MFVQQYTANKNMLEDLNKAARNYSHFCGKDYLYICFDKNNITNTLIFKTHYEEKYFMHLCGIKSANIDATTFYNKCLDSSITINDCVPAYNHTMKDIISKINILPSFFDLKNMKMFKADDPNIQPPKAEFDMGIGNEIGFIGYRYEKCIHKFLPVTNMPQPLTKYCFDPQKISMVMSKEFDDKLFGKIEFEISKNLLSKVDISYYYTLSDFIDDRLLNDCFLDRIIGDSQKENPVIESLHEIE